MRLYLLLFLACWGCTEAASGDAPLDAAAALDAGAVDGAPDAAPLVDAARPAADARASADAGAPADATALADGAAPPPDAAAPADAATPPPDAAAPPPPPAVQAFFNHPPPDGSADTALEDVLIDLLAQAAPGAEIRAAWYTFSRRRMARAFVEAAERGVDVRFVLGNTNVQAGCVDWDAVADLKAGLGADHVTVCRPCADGGGCIGDGINHNKFMTVSRLLDGSTDVVMQSSANLTNPQLHQHNNLVVVRGDAALHAAYRAYWEDLRRQRRDLDYYHIEDGADGRRVYFYPRASGDTVVSIIGNTDCAAGARIRVAMAFFTNARLEVARALADARRAGCRVTALLREEPPTYPGDDVLATLRAGGVTVRLFPVVGERSIHSKYLLIDGQYAGSQRRLVWTGSHNYTGPALRGNDETLLRLEDDAVFAAYEADFAAIEAAIRALP